MTGKIKAYDARNSSGWILSDTGHDVPFDARVVVAYDVNWLAVGQQVTFQAGSLAGSKASYVSVETPRASAVEVKREPPVTLRYLGFDQERSLRAYRFERVHPGSDNEMFTVTTELSLFAKHRVAIQEGPALCRTLLMGEELNAGAHTFALTEKCLMEFVAARVVPVRKPFKKRAPVVDSVAPVAFAAGQGQI